MKLTDKIQIKRAQRKLNKAASILGRITFVDSTIAEAITGTNALASIENALVNLEELLKQ